MKQYLAFVAAALLGSSGIAYATGADPDPADQHAQVATETDPAVPADPAAGAPPGDPADERSGEIMQIDPTRSTITLDTGEEFVVPEHELTQLSPGQRVIVPSYEERDGQWFADTVMNVDEGN